MRTRLRRPKGGKYSLSSCTPSWGVKIARSFRSAASRCASADFTPFPLSAFGAMAEVAKEIDGVGGAGGDRGRRLLSFCFEKKGGAAEFVKKE